MTFLFIFHLHGLFNKLIDDISYKKKKEVNERDLEEILARKILEDYIYILII